MLRIYDTAERAKVDFVPRIDGQVSMYVCGPTPYGEPHLGHGRKEIVFDTIRRYLIWRGYAVTYVSNVTDIEDKIIARAQSEGTTEPELRTFDAAPQVQKAVPAADGSMAVLEARVPSMMAQGVGSILFIDSRTGLRGPQA